MGIEIRRNADGSLKTKWWYGGYQVNGKRLAVNLGVEVEGKVPHSLRTAGDAKFEQSRGKAQAALERQKREAMTRKSSATQLEQIYEIRTGEKVGSIPLQELADHWLKAPHPRERSQRYTQQSEATIKDFVEFIGKRYPTATTLDRVNRKMAEEWLASLDDDKISPATYSDKLVLLRSVFKLLRHTAGMAWNPFDGLPTRKRQTIHRKPFTPAELKKIIAHADAVVRPVIITGICTAMRRGDCCLLKWADVDLKQGFVVVKTSKTGETAEIPILPLLREELGAASAARGALTIGDGSEEEAGQATDAKDADMEAYVWPAAARMFLKNRYGVTYRTAKAIEAAGVKGTTEKMAIGPRHASVKDFHSLRTTWITLALSAGVPMELVRRVTGHTTTDVVLKHYFRPGRKDFKKALKGAMPRLLTDGAEGAAEEKDAKTQILEICARATAESWKKDVEQIVAIAEGM